MKKIGLTIICLISIGFAFAQNIITGVVTDSKTGMPLGGVSIIEKSTNLGTSTNLKGEFTLKTSTTGNTILVFTYAGAELTVADVMIEAGKITYQNVSFEQKAKTEETIIIRSTSTARKETAAALISFQKNTNTVAQVISAESIRRSPDKNTGEVLKRVPGASVQEGKYLVIRGLADRYNTTMLNGILMSSTEPDRKTFSFDIIPSSLIDNMIINKAFVPEFPGEWAGGLVQVNTKDVPSKNFFNVQLGTGFNTQTLGKDFYTYEGGKTDWLGFDDGTRALPSSLPLRGAFASLSVEEKTAFASSFKNTWDSKKIDNAAGLNQSLQLSGGFTKSLGGRNKLAAILAVTYNRSNKILNFENQISTFQNNLPDVGFLFQNKKYSQDVLAGAIGNITLQLGKDNKISFKNILNVNATDYTTLRNGVDFERFATGASIRATELAFKANTFFNTQVTGEHNITKLKTKLHWFGSFNILDQYIPDQRRLQYVKEPGSAEFTADLGNSNSSQKSGSRYYGFLNDYVYTAGGDLSKTFKVGGRDQTIKGGYFFQVKDRLFDSRPFAYYLPSDNAALRALPAASIFNAENFGAGKFALNELPSNRYRYLANSILNAGFIQLDNQLSDKLRVVYGLRVEDFDQIVGSLNKNDDRFVNTKVTDFLPGLNATYKVDKTTNVRLSASQTVIRPEFRELSTFQFFDFDLGSTVAGNTGLLRTKVSNFDLRYELYPRAGELFTIGAFYKYFQNPIESFFNPGTGGGTYNFINAKEANSFGAEVEVRKKLDNVEALKNFTVQSNISYIYNRVNGVAGTSTGGTLDRPMQGQSPYLINASIQYDLEKQGIATTLLFNQIGRRIAYVGGQDGEAPNIWENPRPILDFQITKSIMNKKGEVKLNVGDIINKTAIFYYDLNDNKKYDAANDNFAIKRKYGSNISLSFGYNF